MGDRLPIGMTSKKSQSDNVVEIDTQLYERMAILGMRMGRDDVTELMNDMLSYQMRREQEEKI